MGWTSLKGAVFCASLESAFCTKHLQAAAGLAYVHSKRVLHRDLKPANLLVKQGRLLLADFGLSVQLPLGQDVVQGRMGTVQYLAPEACDERASNAARRTAGPAGSERPALLLLGRHLGLRLQLLRGPGA